MSDNSEQTGGHIVIVGAGQAGVQTAEALRAGGYAGAITMVGDEPHGPYHRPPLSKAWLAGEIGAAQLVMRAPELLAKKLITLRTGVTVLSIDRAAKLVTLDDGSHLAYTGLVLAAGSTPRALPLPGADAPNVLALRTRDDASAIAGALQRCIDAALPVIVIGGGFIGLEVAATACKKGLTVTVLEVAPRLLGRVLPPLLSDWYADLHRGHGVDVQLGVQIASIEQQGGLASAVVLSDGGRLPAGVIVVGIGVSANDALARAAGLECDRGIVVDACSRTSDPAIVAAGDITARRQIDGSLLRLESVQNATEQAKSAAAWLLGQERPFTAVPWFWSDQYDKKLQMAGLSAGADRHVLRGDPAGGSFSVYHLAAGQLVAVESINASKDHLLARKLIEAGVAPSDAQIADSGFDLAALLVR